MESLGTGSRSSSTESLLRRIRAGDRASLEILFARSYHRLERVVRIRWGVEDQPRYDLADVLQEAFLKAYRDLDGYEKRPESSFLHWVACIAGNVLKDQVRRQRAARRSPEREQRLSVRPGAGPLLALDDLVASPVDGPVHRAAEQENMRLLDECLAELPEAEREVLLLRYYLDASWAEVGRQLGRSARGAEQLARRAKLHLAASYRERFGEGAGR